MMRAQRLAAALDALAAHLRDEELTRIATFATIHGCGLSADFTARGAAILAEVDALLAARSPGAGQPTQEAGVWRCSFCGKTQDEVRKLIAGPTVHICNECIDLCNDIVEEEGLDDDEDDAGADDVTAPASVVPKSEPEPRGPAAVCHCWHARPLDPPCGMGRTRRAAPWQSSSRRVGWRPSVACAGRPGPGASWGGGVMPESLTPLLVVIVWLWCWLVLGFFLWRGRGYLDHHPRVARAISTGMLVFNVGMIVLITIGLTVVAIGATLEFRPRFPTAPNPGSWANPYEATDPVNGERFELKPRLPDLGPGLAGAR